MTRLPTAAATFVALLTLVTFYVASADSKTPPGQSPPTSTALPSITGTLAVGSTLQASSGLWTGRGISYSFQWQRCAGAACVSITGATGSSYLVAAGDAGDTLQVSVTAVNRLGSATATSAPTGVVASAGATDYTNTTLPVISGTAGVGQKLSVSNGSWSPTASGFQFAWHRCQSGSCSLSPTNADQATYNVQPGDAGYTIVAEVAPDGNWSESAESHPTASVTNSAPPPSDGTVLFDGRASNMTTLYSYETTPGNINTLQHGQSPNLWTCLCFEKNDLSLQSDSTYGQSYRATVAIGDSNPWNSEAASTSGAGQVSVRRDNNLGRWDWYAISLKVPSWAGALANINFVDILSVGYQTANGDQVGLGLMNNNGTLSWQMHQNSGYASSGTGFANGTVHYKTPILPVSYGQWQEFVVGVKWATDNTGAVEVYTRTPGAAWQQVFEKLNEATYLYGTTPYGTFAQDGSNWPTVIDKIGLYFGELGGITPTETLYESGLTRSSDLATAESTLP